jgi:CspA family cold shock protein
MAKGKVKWFDTKKRFGFITPDDGSKDIFVHISAVESAGLRTLDEGQSIEFDLEENRGKPAAVNLQLLA